MVCYKSHIMRQNERSFLWILKIVKYRLEKFTEYESQYSYCKDILQNWQLWEWRPSRVNSSVVCQFPSSYVKWKSSSHSQSTLGCYQVSHCFFIVVCYQLALRRSYANAKQNFFEFPVSRLAWWVSAFREHCLVLIAQEKPGDFNFLYHAFPQANGARAFMGTPIWVGVLYCAHKALLSAQREEEGFKESGLLTLQRTFCLSTTSKYQIANY